MEDDKIYHCKVPTLPQFRFEWHPATKKLYLIRIGPVPEHAEPIGHGEIETQGQAIQAVLYWCRGYHEAKREFAANVNRADNRRSAKAEDERIADRA